MRKYIVTGATGFLGRSFTDWLIKKNENVVVIVRDKDVALDMWGNKVDIIERDLADVGGIEENDLGDGEDERIMIHFAWEGTSGDKRALEMTQLNNVRISSELVRKAQNWRCKRFINAGSIMEYEAMKTVIADGERPSKNTMYSIAKLTANLMMKTIAADIGIDYVNVIISNIYGPGETSKRFLNNVIRSMINNESLKLTEGKQIYDFIYVDDAMEMIKAVSEDGTPFESYYIGNKIQRPLREFVIEAKKVINSESELLFGEIPFIGQALNYTEFDCGKLEKIGVYPKITFEEGIRRTKDWIINNTEKRKNK